MSQDKSVLVKTIVGVPLYISSVATIMLISGTIDVLPATKASIYLIWLTLLFETFLYGYSQGFTSKEIGAVTQARRLHLFLILLFVAFVPPVLFNQVTTGWLMTPFMLVYVGTVVLAALIQYGWRRFMFRKFAPQLLAHKLTWEHVKQSMCWYNYVALGIILLLWAPILFS